MNDIVVGSVMLIPPLLALFWILRGGRWHWDIAPSDAVPSAMMRSGIDIVFWVGWVALIVVGVMLIVA